MVEYDEIKLKLSSLRESTDKLEVSLNLSRVREEIEELEKESSNPDFWNDSDNSTKVLQKLKAYKDKVSSFEKLVECSDEIELSIEIAEEEEDPSLAGELEKQLVELEKNIEIINLETLLSGEYDKNNVILSVHAGAGGKEAQDWATMLVRMYCRWGASKGFKVEMLDSVAGDDNRYYKSATIEIKGKNAYGMLKNEAGVHRLVRVSPFDANGRRHTSFSAVEVMPEVELDKEVSIRNEDLRIDYFRASGAGGQHVNTTDSAVRITHLPTGIVVSCQNERSQHQNRDYAMKMLVSKLVKIKEEEHLNEISEIKGEQKQIQWGSQIRSYVFMPYQLVKDHRTNAEVGDIEGVLDGDLDAFIMV